MHGGNPPLSNPSKAFAYGILLASCGWYFGFGVGSFNTFFDYFIESAYGVQDRNRKIEISGNLNLMFMMGGAVVCLVGSKIYEVFGRHRSLLLTILAEIVITFFMMFKSLEILYICRFAQGFVSCFWSILAPLMIKENLPISLANKVGPLFYVFLTGGILLGYCLGSPWAGSNWRAVLAIPLISELPKLALFSQVYVMESPDWLVVHNPDALRANFELLYDSLVSATLTAEAVARKPVIHSGLESAVPTAVASRGGLKLRLGLGTFMNLLNQLTCINFLMFYSKGIFEQMKVPSPTGVTIFMGSLNCLGGVFLIFFLEKIGKRNLIILGLLGQGVAYIIFLNGLVFKASFLVVLGPCAYMFSFSISLGGLIYSYVCDIVPAEVVPFCAFCQWGLACLVVKYAVILVDKLGAFWVFFFGMVMSFIGALVFIGYAVDTTNKTDAQINKEFEMKTFLRG